MAQRVFIFDTTLRDGEQSPGASMNTVEKIKVAKQLARLKVDIIEAGFPIASPGDFEAVSLISREVKGVRVAALARCSLKDIEAAWGAVKGAEAPRIHVFLSTSPIHLKHQLKMSPEEVLERITVGVSKAKGYVSDVEFSPMDASRTEPEFLAQAVQTAIAAGATTVNIPDTVGYALPSEFGGLIRFLRKNVPDIDQAV
ncbi:MAG: 2-isopropylmalate synthase, partial [Deltaproteobacteria bacterium]|nr:2-isopropylmalate synthase [Deltaproteobacteria bacterium]